MNMKQKLNYINDLLKNERAEEAKAVFGELMLQNTADYFLTEGKIEQKFQNWGAAINAFNKVLAIDPENTEAQHNLHLIKNILNFWNPDMFNP